MSKGTIRNNSNKFIPLNQKLKDIGNIYRDFAGYDMSYDEFKQLCRKAWEDDYIYRCVDRSKKRHHGRYCTYKKNKKTYLECTPETKPF